MKIKNLILVALVAIFLVIPANSVVANGITYTYQEIDMSGVYNSDAYTPGLNYTSGTYYPINPGTTYNDPLYGNVPMDMRAAGTFNVWLSHGTGRTSGFSTTLTLSTNVQNAVAIWLVGLDGGWVYGGSQFKVGYTLNSAYSELTYETNDWCRSGTGAGLNLWVDREDNCGDIAVLRIDLPETGVLTEIKVIDPDSTNAGDSFPIFAVTVAAEEIPIDVDIKPTSCPNPINVNSMGVIPAAILGSEDLDVTMVDPSTIELEGVSPLRWAMDDIAGPGCSGPDGYPDLTFKFRSQEIAAALDPVNDRDVIILHLTGNLKLEFGETPIAGDDDVLIIKNES